MYLVDSEHSHGILTAQFKWTAVGFFYIQESRKIMKLDPGKVQGMNIQKHFDICNRNGLRTPFSSPCILTSLLS